MKPCLIMKKRWVSNASIAKKSLPKKFAPLSFPSAKCIWNFWNRLIPESPIAKFLEKNPSGGIHHIAFGSDNVATQLKQAAGAGVRLINEKPVEGAAGKLVAFLHPKSTFGVLTELCMTKPGSTNNH